MYQHTGEEAGECTIPKAFQKSEANAQMIKDYLVALRKNARQWSAHTQGRSDVNHSKKKPHRQKGTGNARQGSLAAPQYKGGGVVFGPRPKFDQHVRINRQERRAAIAHLMAEKIADKKVLIVKDFKGLKQPQTKAIVALMKGADVTLRSPLFVGESDIKEGQTVSSDRHDNLKKSIRNLPGSAFVLASQVNGYDLACAHCIVMTQAAVKELEQIVGGK